ncbi:MAG: RNA polymerase-associated protein RapA, partial [Gammaproteobacteria bacterium]|nr:RNA polymerase-associated protein RapA [Gammaproteobacteria bacterium]
MFAIGQRWICDAELDLGLGTVLTVEHRTVTIVFLASGETRTYSQQTAPLRRVLFSVGDQVESHEGWTLKISEIHEEDGVLTYLGKDESGKLRALNEGNLSNAIQLNRPLDRMLSGQVDANKWFELRNQALAHKVNLQNSNLIGLSDSRTSLIPHQLYIAHEVAKRFAPRVLLADEVGLGKTIEACLIMQHQLISGRAKRILIIVPEALLHQWLVELLRRFNLSFSILDAERCEAITESSEFENPFHAEQHVLCTMETLTQNSERLTHAIAGEWDLVIIDEAHHLEWSEDKVSVEYQAAEALAKSCKGLLLLTATPEQLGKAGHFARLRLLDPQRFHSYRDFLEEEKHYQQVASAIQSIVDESVLDQTTRERLEDWLATSESDEQMVELKQLLAHEGELDESHKTKIVNLLLDRHGTGRVLYRNTRNTVKGFPQRIVNLHPLPMPEQYGQLYVTAQRYEKEEDSIL